MIHSKVREVRKGFLSPRHLSRVGGRLTNNATDNHSRMCLAPRIRTCWPGRPAGSPPSAHCRSYSHPGSTLSACGFTKPPGSPCCQPDFPSTSPDLQLVTFARSVPHGPHSSWRCPQLGINFQPLVSQQQNHPAVAESAQAIQKGCISPCVMYHVGLPTAVLFLCRDVWAVIISVGNYTQASPTIKMDPP